MAGNAAVPYRRETFTHKRILLDFDGDFNVGDGSSMSNNANAKSFSRISHDLDSLKEQYDSIGRVYYSEDQRMAYYLPQVSVNDSVRSLKLAASNTYDVDSAFSRLSADKRRSAVSYALQQVKQRAMDLDFKQMITSDGDRLIRQHQIEWVRKITLALTCLIFFFIGAPLGAIIRKGGLGLPVLISVLVFIVYYILDNSGYRMARGGMWAVWFGNALAPAVLVPMAVFFTYKATITDPDYAADLQTLERISAEIDLYSQNHRLRHAPNWVKVFFKYEPDHKIEAINEELETVIEDLSNSRDRTIVNHLSAYPIMSVKAHTRPFERRWLNVVSAVIVPFGLVLYFRMWRYRLRLWRDLRTVKNENDIIIGRIKAII